MARIKIGNTDDRSPSSKKKPRTKAERVGE
jgi:hypothetical protein